MTAVGVGLDPPFRPRTSVAGGERLTRRVAVCALAVALAVGMIVVSSGSAHASAQPSGPVSPEPCSAATLAGRSYSPMYDDNTLQVFSGEGLHTVGTVGGLSRPAEMVTSGDGYWGSGSLRVMDACTLRTIALIPVGGFSIVTYIAGSDGSLGGRYMYVSSLADEDVNVVDTWTNTIVRRYLVPGIAGVQQEHRTAVRLNADHGLGDTGWQASVGSGRRLE